MGVISAFMFPNSAIFLIVFGFMILLYIAGWCCSLVSCFDRQRRPWGISTALTMALATVALFFVVDANGRINFMLLSFAIGGNVISAIVALQVTANSIGGFGGTRQAVAGSGAPHRSSRGGDA